MPRSVALWRAGKAVGRASSVGWLVALAACAARPTAAHVIERSALSPAPAEPVRREPPAPSPLDEATRSAEACLAIDPERYALPPSEDHVFDAPLPAIVDPSAEVMAPLYAHLAALLRGRITEPVRIGIYGDSNMTQDGISGGLRRVLQAKLGDAGHGYVALGRAWPWYAHLDVKHGAVYRDWVPYSTSVQPAPDSYYGFANMAFDSARAGALTYVETASEDAPVGHTVSHFDAYFLARPAGGSFRVAIDGKVEREVSTAATTVNAAFARFDVPDGPHRFELVVTGKDPVRVFGVTLERDAPGVIVDSLGTGALNYEQMTRVDGPTRRAMLERRRYDLVLYLLGSNVYAPSQKVLNRWVGHAVEAQRAATPRLPVLILSPTDIAESMDAKGSLPRIVRLVAMLRAAAAATGAAYWDFWSAMGGDLSIVRLRKKRGLAATDLVHLTRLSGAKMGDRIARALMAGFAGYLADHPDAGCAGFEGVATPAAPAE